MRIKNFEPLRKQGARFGPSKTSFSPILIYVCVYMVLSNMVTFLFCVVIQNRKQVK